MSKSTANPLVTMKRAADRSVAGLEERNLASHHSSFVRHTPLNEVDLVSWTMPRDEQPAVIHLLHQAWKHLN